MGFADIPDILPLKPKDAMSSVDYSALMKTTEEEKTPGPNGGLFNYDTENLDSKQKLLDRFDLIRKRKIKMT